MPTTITPLLADLLVTAHRLTRIAAQATGSTTPSAVWHTLSVLVADGPLRIGELATKSRVTQPSMTKVVKQIIDDGLARREGDPNDSRAWLIVVTAAGISALENWRAKLASALEPMFAGLSTSEISTVANAVEILASHTTTNRKAA